MLPLKKDLKLVRSLHQKKFRRETGLFIVEGRKIVEEAMRSEFVLHSVYSWDESFCEAHKDAMYVNTREMDQMSTLSSPSGYLAVLHQRDAVTEIADEGVVLVLDGIADPGNLGTMIRTAEWFDVRQIFCTDDCVEHFNPKVVQATMGSVFRMPVIYDTVSGIGMRLKANGYKLIAADLQGESIYTFDIPKATAIVIGSESHGIRPEMKAQLDTSVTIPGGGHTESLNASVAAAVILSELFRRR